MPLLKNTVPLVGASLVLLIATGCADSSTRVAAIQQENKTLKAEHEKLRIEKQRLTQQLAAAIETAARMHKQNKRLSDQVATHVGKLAKGQVQQAGDVIVRNSMRHQPRIKPSNLPRGGARQATSYTQNHAETTAQQQAVQLEIQVRELRKQLTEAQQRIQQLEGRSTARRR